MPSCPMISPAIRVLGNHAEAERAELQISEPVADRECQEQGDLGMMTKSIEENLHVNLLSRQPR